MSVKTVYGLMAKGYNGICSGEFKSFSKNIFMSKEGAENHKAEFIELCCDESLFYFAERKGLKIIVVEYILNE